jgi:hypothetical protein
MLFFPRCIAVLILSIATYESFAQKMPPTALDLKAVYCYSHISEVLKEFHFMPQDLRRQFESQGNRLNRYIVGRIKFLDTDGLKAINLVRDQHREDSAYWKESMKVCTGREINETSMCVDQQRDRDPVLRDIWTKNLECESLSWLPF